MKVLAIYIFREDGVPLLSRFYDDQVHHIDGLVAPFLVSVSNRLEELTGSTRVESISLGEDMHLVMEQFAEIICALVISEKTTVELNLDLVARKFFKKYHRTLGSKGWSGRLENFDAFIPEMEELLGIDPEITIVSMPHEVLDAFIMSDYSKSDQVIIRHLIKETEARLDELLTLGESEEAVKELLDDLLSKEFLGLKQTKKGESIYFKLN